MQNWDHSEDYKTVVLFVRLLQHHRNKIAELVWSAHNIPVWNGNGHQLTIDEIHSRLGFRTIEYLREKFLERSNFWTVDANNRWSFCLHFPRIGSTASESTKSFPSFESWFSETGPNLLGREILTATRRARDLGFCVQIYSQSTRGHRPLQLKLDSPE